MSVPVAMAQDLERLRSNQHLRWKSTNLKHSAFCDSKISVIMAFNILAIVCAGLTALTMVRTNPTASGNVCWQAASLPHAFLLFRVCG